MECCEMKCDDESRGPVPCRMRITPPSSGAQPDSLLDLRLSVLTWTFGGNAPLHLREATHRRPIQHEPV
jgi:hypothetical protein